VGVFAALAEGDCDDGDDGDDGDDEDGACVCDVDDGVGDDAAGVAASARGPPQLACHAKVAHRRSVRCDERAKAGQRAMPRPYVALSEGASMTAMVVFLSLLAMDCPSGASALHGRELALETARLLEGACAPVALARVRALESELAQKAALEVADGRLLRAPAAAFGVYEPAPGNIVAGKEIYLYATVRNFGSRSLPDGTYELHLVSDLVILDAVGAELARDTGFGESRFAAHTPHRDTFVNIAVAAKGLPPGDYRARLVIHDRVLGKQGEVEVPLHVR